MADPDDRADPPKTPAPDPVTHMWTRRNSSSGRFGAPRRPRGEGEGPEPRR
jgi:hypothetical protein